MNQVPRKEVTEKKHTHIMEEEVKKTMWYQRKGVKLRKTNSTFERS